MARQAGLFGTSLGNCSCVALPPVTHMDVENGKAMLEHRNPSMQSCASPFGIATLIQIHSR